MSVIAIWDHSKWLFLSSFLFTAPAIFAYHLELYTYSYLLVLTSLVSANYWRVATYSWRRNMDLVLARISLFTFISNGVIYVRYIPYMIVGYSGMYGMYYSYNLSGKLWDVKDPNWYKYHVLFHIIMTIELFIILDSVPKRMDINNL
jgi:hypothetical protein